MRAEGVPVGMRYITDPIYLRGDFLVKKVTFGESQFPFDSDRVSRNYDYRADLVPNAVQALKTVAVMSFHEQMTNDDVDDIASAVRKVASNLS